MKHPTYIVDWQLMVLSWLFCALAVLILVLALTGCGGSPKSVAAAEHDPAQHHASFSDPRLQAMWVQAQEKIATTPIVLNAAKVSLRIDVVNVTRPPDSRALNIWPDGVTVSTAPDLTVAQLQAENPGETLHHFTDPTGVIHPPKGAIWAYCASYVQGSSIVVAESLLYGDHDPTEYEMENVILQRLGYDVIGR